MVMIAAACIFASSMLGGMLGALVGFEIMVENENAPFPGTPSAVDTTAHTKTTYTAKKETASQSPKRKEDSLKTNNTDESQTPKTNSKEDSLVTNSKEDSLETNKKNKHEPTNANKENLYRLDGSASFEAATAEITKGMDRLETELMTGAASLCKSIRGLNRSYVDPTLLVNSTGAVCRSGQTGNQLATLLDYRFATFAERRTAYINNCGIDAIEAGQKEVLPWVTGYFPASWNRPPPFGMAMPDNYCTPPPLHPHERERDLSLALRYMLPLLRYEFRRMAVAIMGVPDVNHPSAAFEQEYLPEAPKPPYTPSDATGAIYRIPHP